MNVRCTSGAVHAAARVCGARHPDCFRLDGCSTCAVRAALCVAAGVAADDQEKWEGTLLASAIPPGYADGPDINPFRGPDRS